MNGLLIVSLDSGLPLFTRMCCPLSPPTSSNQRDVMQLASLLFALRKISTSELHQLGSMEVFDGGREFILTVVRRVHDESVLLAIVVDRKFFSEKLSRRILEEISSSIEELLPLLKDSNQPRVIREYVENLLSSLVHKSVKEILSCFQSTALSIKLITTLKEVDLNGPKFQSGSGINITPAKQAQSSPSLIRGPTDTAPLVVTTAPIDRNNDTMEVPIKNSRGICCCFPFHPVQSASREKSSQIKESTAEAYNQPQQYQTPARPNRSEGSLTVQLPPSTGKRSDTRYDVDILVLFFDLVLNQQFKEDLFNASVAFGKSFSNYAYDLPIQRVYIGDNLIIPVHYNPSDRKFQPHIKQHILKSGSISKLELVSIEEEVHDACQHFEYVHESSPKRMEILIDHDMLCLIEWKLNPELKSLLYQDIQDILLYIHWCYTQKLPVPGFCYGRDML